MNASSKFFITGNIPIRCLYTPSTLGQDLDHSLCWLLVHAMESKSMAPMKSQNLFTAALAGGWVIVWLNRPTYVPWMNIHSSPPPSPCSSNHLWTSIYSPFVQIRKRKWILPTRGKCISLFPMYLQVFAKKQIKFQGGWDIYAKKLYYPVLQC